MEPAQDSATPNHPDANSPLADEPIFKFFGYLHLPPKLQEVSRPFCELAADHTSGSWKPTVGAFAGVKVEF